MDRWWESAVGERYQALALSDALNRPFDYPSACQELSHILRLAYSKLPKKTQSLVFRDTLSAFRRLPEVQTSYAKSSANILFQAAEAMLPKQKRTLAVSEFKHAVVAHKRNCKPCQNEGLMQLPQDVIVHIFSFLDMRSLINVTSVCRAWNSAASDNMLWQIQYFLLFGKYESYCKNIEKTCKIVQHKEANVLHQSTQDVVLVTNINWREAFKSKYTGNPSWTVTSNRASCEHCGSIILLSSITRVAPHHFDFAIKPISSKEVVKYILDGTFSEDTSDSDSDSESWWVAPKLSVD